MILADDNKLSIRKIMVGLRRILPYKLIPVLLYHQIVETTKEEDYLRLAVPTHKFEQQMYYLFRNGYTTITLDDLIQNKYKDLSKNIAITFDDGYMDNYINAFPILQTFKFSATIFIITNFLGKRHAWNSYKPADYMDWSHCKEMLTYGISFQSHTCNHPDLTASTNDEALKELLESKNRIEDILGIPVNHFSYPFGRYNRTIMQWTEKAGYKAAYTTGYSRRENYCVERFQIKPDDGKLLFALKNSNWGSWVRSLNNLNANF